MNLSPDQQRRLDAVVGQLAEEARVHLAGIINDVTAERVREFYGDLETPEAQETARVVTYVRAERVIAESFAANLTKRILNPRRVA
jgi:hypothetical protein